MNIVPTGLHITDYISCIQVLLAFTSLLDSFVKLRTVGVGVAQLLSFLGWPCLDLGTKVQSWLFGLVWQAADSSVDFSVCDGVFHVLSCFSQVTRQLVWLKQKSCQIKVVDLL